MPLSVDDYEATMADDTPQEKKINVNSPAFLAAQARITKRIVDADPDPFRPFEPEPANEDTKQEDDAPSWPAP